MLLAGEVTATAWLPTCDVISARQWSYPVSALSGVHLHSSDGRKMKQDPARWQFFPANILPHVASQHRRHLNAFFPLTGSSTYNRHRASVALEHLNTLVFLNTNSNLLNSSSR